MTQDTTTPTELLPCPFCGGEAHLIPHAVIKRIRFYVQCEHCDCRTPPLIDETTAITAWNTRLAHTDEVARFKAQEAPADVSQGRVLTFDQVVPADMTTQHDASAVERVDPDAINALRNYQQQLDMDGVIVGVSRQALNELLAWYAAMTDPDALKAERERCAKVAEWGCMVPPDGGSPTEAERELCDSIAQAIRNLGDR